MAPRRAARLAGEPQEMGEPAGGRVDVDRPDQHLGVLVEDRLRPVAVVGVDVDTATRRAGVAQPRRPPAALLR